MCNKFVAKGKRGLRIKLDIPYDNALIIANGNKLITVPCKLIYRQYVALIAFFATDDLVQFKIVGTPYFDAFVHACCREVGQRRMKRYMVYGEQMSRDILDEFERY